jgi:hypothetical protein
MALWSANGTYWKTMRSLSLSKDAQPPFLHCIDSTHWMARLTDSPW